MIEQLLSLAPWSNILRFLGYEVKKPSLLKQTIMRTTNQSWLESLYNNNRIDEYSYKIYAR